MASINENKVARCRLTIGLFVLAAVLCLLPIGENFFRPDLALRNRIQSMPSKTNADFRVNYTASKILARGDGARVYDLWYFVRSEKELFPEGGPAPVMTPPFALPFILPLSLLPAEHAGMLWTLIISACSVLTVLILRATFKLSSLHCAGLFVALFLSGPYHSSIRLGELGPFGLLCFSLAISMLDGKKCGLAAFALAPTMVKPQWALAFLVYLLGARRYRVLGYLFLLIAILVIASLFLYGTDIYNSYMQLAHFLLKNPRWCDIKDASTLSGQIVRLFPALPCEKYAPYLVVTYCSALALIFWLAHRFRENFDWLERGLIVALPIGMAASLHYKPYDLIFLTPALLALSRSSFLPASPRLVKCVLAICALLLLNPIYHWLSIFSLRSEEIVNPYFWIIWVIAIVCVYLSCRQDRDGSELGIDRTG